MIIYRSYIRIIMWYNRHIEVVYLEVKVKKIPPIERSKIKI